METELQYLKRDVDEIKVDVADIKAKQDQMISMLTEANGMRKIIRWMWAVALFFGGVGLTYWSSIKAMFIKIGG